MPSKAELSEMVVIWKVPLWVVDVPSYIYCMLFCVVMVRVAERSILKSLTGSKVARSCRFSVLLVVAGVAIESLQSSQSFSLAFPI